jgi:hypothetical protein
MLAGRRFLKEGLQNPHVEKYTDDLTKAICTCNRECEAQASQEALEEPELVQPEAISKQPIKKEKEEKKTKSVTHVHVKHAMHRKGGKVHRSAAYYKLFAKKPSSIP